MTDTLESHNPQTHQKIWAKLESPYLGNSRVGFTSNCIDGQKYGVLNKKKRRILSTFLVPFESLDHPDSGGVSKHTYLYNCVVLMTKTLK